MGNPTYSDLPFVDAEAGTGAAPWKGGRATCVECGATLIAKCGDINRWHWAHESGGICASSDGEGAWHRAWKLWATQYGAQTEVSNGHHRADIVWSDGTVYELQSNYLNLPDIRSREEHWGDRLVWIYRITPGRFERLWNVGDGWFRWARPAPSMAMHERPVVWHVNDRLYDATFRFDGDDVQVRFKRGDDDQYGPNLYGSRAAPFDLNNSVTELNRLRYMTAPTRAVS